MYSRYLKKRIIKRVDSGKAIVVMGPRQVGKTTLIESILESKDYLLFNGDDPKTRALLTEPNTEQIRSIIGKYEYFFIDEAQRIEGKFKWQKKKNQRLPKTFTEAYNAETKVIDKENFREFVRMD